MDSFDPFATINLPATHQNSQLYISGHLSLLQIPFGVCGEWFSLNGIWHRRMDANAFLWLRAAVHHAIQSGTLPTDFPDATGRLQSIAAIGITRGAFTVDEIADHCEPPGWYQFNDWQPRWADHVDGDFPPPAKNRQQRH